MAQTSPQFTPTQILAAGERAEAEGQRDYAVQFYRHLVDHHTASVEALIARNGLARLEPAPEAAISRLSLVPPPWKAEDDADRDWHPRGHTETAYGHAAPSHPHQYDNGYAGPTPHETTARQERRTDEPHQSDWSSFHGSYDDEPAPRIMRPHSDPLPAAARPFLAGRLLAGAISLIGFVFVVVAVSILAVGVTTPRQIVQLADMLGPWSEVPLSGIGAALMLGLGASLVLLGQLASAVFAIAGAGRDIAARLRHRDHGTA